MKTMIRPDPSLRLGAIAIAWLVVLVAGCAPRAYRFADRRPVAIYDDRRPVPLPEETDYQIARYAVETLVRRPIVSALRVSAPVEAQDINSWDDVPESSWFHHRLGYEDISPQELVRGEDRVGPPRPPVTVVKAKVGGGNPGFIVADARGARYLIKFDPPHLSGLETTTALIVNRIFWGFGYNVPEDYQFFFEADQLDVDPDGELSDEDVQAVLDHVAPPVEKVYRSTASHFLEGKIIGPVLAKGTRNRDPNDIIPHEDRRVMRALKVFGAFLNHSDMRIDNSLAVYVGEPGTGHVRRYLLDFGEALGGHGSEHNWLWDSFDYYFSYSEFFSNFLTLGTRVRPWERIEYTPWPSVGTFEATVFDPANWKPVKPYEPITRSQPADDYWAAKILGQLTPEHIAALVSAARYPEDAAAKYVLTTLLERRRKVLDFAFANVSSVDADGFSGGSLHLQDTARIVLPRFGVNSSYEVTLYDGRGKRIGEKRLLPGADHFDIEVPNQTIRQADGYVRIDVRTIRNGRRAPAPAQFHVRAHATGARLVGIVH